MESMTFDFPLPLGPTTEEKLWIKHTMPSGVSGRKSGQSTGQRSDRALRDAQRPHLVERPDALDARVRLKVFELPVRDNKSHIF